ncbi:11939_t:CDS:2 [Acaulospora morrowiae]|uniref:11939_t:CDS:1 n=1 Tax=Acaulospora morrowiae TaxID=94023 RepID=A0A9N9H5T3_9GLOM|nr:11939_t:CDS:2 [Acaulospora morrowiae]
MNLNRLSVLVIIFLITTISVTHSFPSGKCERDNDACANIKQSYLATHYINYADVKNCYESFPYNSTRSSELIDILKKLYGNFYVYLNQAKEPPQPGFDYKPVDLLKEFDLLLEKDHQSDFEFMVVVLLCSRFFYPNCYSIFQFDQEIYLYSAVKPDGTQKDSSLVDCEVTHINGELVFDVLVEYAKTKSSVSRDLGVRFNSVLSSSIYHGEFAFRTKLPENETISYDFLCSGQNHILTSLGMLPLQIVPYLTNLMMRIAVAAESLLKVESVADFYKLDEIGIVQVYSFGVPGVTTEKDIPNIYKSFVDGFNLLIQANVKKIVLDFTDNAGGIVDISSFLNILLLNLNYQDVYTLPDDMRVSKIAEFAFNRSTTENLVNDLIFNARLKRDIVTKQFFNTSEEFIGTNYYNREGDEVRFTNNYMNKLTRYATESSKNITKLPWKPSDMIILTNGFCGSSCALTTNFLYEIGQISTVAVGGFYDKPLSFALFASGGVIPTNELIANLQNLGFKRSTDPSFYNIKVSFAQFTHVETYSIINPNEILEFTFRPANHRLYYDKDNLRNITLLWRQAASFIESS